MTELMTQIPGTATFTPAAPAASTTPASPTPRRRSLVSPAAVLLALASPAVTATMLELARHWSDHGARHSIGDMVPLALGGILGLAVTGYAAATEDPLLVGTVGALTACTLGIGMMAYPAGLSEPLIVAGMATVAGWVLTRRQWRAHRIRQAEDDQRQADRDHQANVAGMAAETSVQVAAITAEGKVNRERIKWLGKWRLAELRADAAEFEAWQIETRDRRAAAMAISPTAAAALTQNTAAGLPRTGRTALEPAAGADDLEAVAVAVLGDLSGARRTAEQAC